MLLVVASCVLPASPSHLDCRFAVIGRRRKMDGWVQGVRFPRCSRLNRDNHVRMDPSHTTTAPTACIIDLPRPATTPGSLHAWTLLQRHPEMYCAVRLEMSLQGDIGLMRRFYNTNNPWT